MSTVQADLTVYTNATWIDALIWPGVDLTGMTLKLQLRDPANPQNVVLELSTDNTFLAVTDPAAGHWAFDLPVAAAKDVPPAAYVYDVIAYLPADPRVWRYQSGTLTVTAGVTLR